MRNLGILMCAITMILASCAKEEWNTVDSFVQETYEEMRDGAMGGHHRCYRVMFPVTIVFPDESTSEVEDRVEFITAIKAWKEANPDAEERPTLQMPFSIMRVDGEIIEVTSIEQIRELRRDCRQHKNGHRKCGVFARFLNNKCFEIELPMSLVMADGEIVTIENRVDILRLLKQWKENRPDEIPEISFPINVTVKETGDQVEIADQDALDALVEECKE